MGSKRLDAQSSYCGVMMAHLATNRCLWEEACLSLPSLPMGHLLAMCLKVQNSFPSDQKRGFRALQKVKRQMG